MEGSDARWRVVERAHKGAPTSARLMEVVKDADGEVARSLQGGGVDYVQLMVVWYQRKVVEE